MAWPPDVSDGQIILASHINAIKNSVSTWPGDVDAGQTWSLRGANHITLAGVPASQDDGQITFGPGTGKRVSWWATGANFKFGVRMDDFSGQVHTRFYAPDAYSDPIFEFGTLATADGTTFTSKLSISMTEIAMRGHIRATDLPSSNPGAGTKRFWYDPADGNRVKFAV